MDMVVKQQHAQRRSPRPCGSRCSPRMHLQWDAAFSPMRHAPWATRRQRCSCALHPQPHSWSGCAVLQPPSHTAPPTESSIDEVPCQHRGVHVGLQVVPKVHCPGRARFVYGPVLLLSPKTWGLGQGHAYRELQAATTHHTGCVNLCMAGCSRPCQYARPDVRFQPHL